MEVERTVVADHAGVILIADHNPDSLALLGTVLEGAGYKVRGAPDGVQALEIAASHVLDLILLDLQIPGLDGFEVCRRLKNDPATRDIPVIAINALDQVADKVRVFEAGAVDYVTTPFHSPELLSRVGTHLQLFRLRRELDRKGAELEARNTELQRKNEELSGAYISSDRAFSALAAALPGTLLDGKYALDKKIGAGGYATVFRAEHLQLKRPVAVKVLRPWAGNDSPKALERFRREGVSACRLNHPNAVAVLDCGISDAGVAYLVMELLEGMTLAKMLADGAPVPLPRCVQILFPVCAALTAAHDSGLVHRDIKPDNIFLHRSPQGEVVKLLDFGIAKIVSEAEGEATRGIVGTPSYVAPERFKAQKYDGRADVYSVGVVLYRMLSGKLPFTIAGTLSPLAAALRSASQPPPPLPAVPGVSRAAAGLVMRALARDPEERPTSREMAAALADLR